MIQEKLKELELQLNYVCYDKELITRLSKVWDAYYDLKSEVKKLNIPVVSGSLASLDYATKVAVRISEEAITPPLNAKEQAMFIAGFQECIKWLNVIFSNDR